MVKPKFKPTVTPLLKGKKKKKIQNETEKERGNVKHHSLVTRI